MEFARVSRPADRRAWARAQLPDAGRIVCACFEVGENAVRAAAADSG